MSDKDFLTLLRTTLREEIKAVSDKVDANGATSNGRFEKLERDLAPIIAVSNELAYIGWALSVVQRHGDKVVKVGGFVLGLVVAVYWPEVLELVESIKAAVR